jgi:glutaredoxin
MYQPTQARLFIKPYCGWCRQAMDWLEDHGIRFEVLDVISNAQAYEEMVRLSGQTLAPVIEVDGAVLADFGARELETFWRRLEDRTPPQP